MVLNRDFTVMKNNRQGSQSLSMAGSGNTKAVIDPEQGIVGGALDKGLIQVKELVRDPVKWTAGMRTTVQVGINLPSLTHDKHIIRPTGNHQFQPPAIRISEIIEFADNGT